MRLFSISNRIGEKGETSIPTQAMDARMGEEEKNRKQKEEQGKKQGAGPQPNYLDHPIASCDLHRSYGGHILKTPHPQGYIYIY